MELELLEMRAAPAGMGMSQAFDAAVVGFVQQSQLFVQVSQLVTPLFNALNSLAVQFANPQQLASLEADLAAINILSAQLNAYSNAFVGH